MALSPGTSISRYEILGPLGAGAMGEVYRARDTRLNRDVALKFLPDASAGDPHRQRRFEIEARAAGTLDHPNLLVVHDVGAHEGVPYIVTECVEGRTLREILRGGALPERKAREYVTQIARGLAAAHAKGVIHRDLKPDNLMVVLPEGRVKILDFGLAKLTEGDGDRTQTMDAHATSLTAPGALLGTCSYMSPEQVRGEKADPRSDIFALGAVLYELLAGHRAFEGPSLVETLSAVLSAEPDLAKTGAVVSPGLLRIVDRCLAKDPQARFQTASDLVFALESISTEVDASRSLPDSPRAKSGALLVTFRAACAVAGLAVVALLTHALWRPAPTAPTWTRLTFRHGRAGYSLFAPDGQTVVYRGLWDQQSFGLFTTVPGQKESREIDPGMNRIWGISSSGMVAGSFNDTLAVVPLGGGAPRRMLTGVCAADWSPTHGDLAIGRAPQAQTGIAVEYPIGTRLFHGPGLVDFLRFSRDGSLLAFIDYPVAGKRAGAVTIIDLTGKVRTVSQEWKTIWGLAWSPRGDEVWFTAGSKGGQERLMALTLQGHMREVAAVPGTSLVIFDAAKDGRILLATARYQYLALARPNGAAHEVPVAWFDGSVVADATRDGRLLLLNETREGGGERGAIYLRTTTGSPAVKLGDGVGYALSPDGKWAIVSDGASPPSLELLPTGPGTAHALPRGDILEVTAARFVDDNRVVLNAQGEHRQASLYLLDTRGAGSLRVLASAGVVSSTLLAVNGDRVASEDRDHNLAIWRISDGSRTDVRVNGARVQYAPIAWSSDGTALMVVTGDLRGNLGAISRLTLSSGSLTPLMTVGPTDRAGFGDFTGFAFTQDGTLVAYSYYVLTNDLFVVRGLR